MNEPLVCEDTDLDRLLESIRAEHGDAADILYQDSVRRGGVMGFFAQEVHRVVYRVCESERDAAAGSTGSGLAPGQPLDLSHDAVDMHPFEAMLAQHANTVDRPSKPAPRQPPAAQPAPVETAAPWLDDLLDDEPAAPIAPLPADEPIDSADTRIVSYSFPRAEPTARPFNNKPQALEELIDAADESENAMLATIDEPPIRMTAQQRFAELLQAMEEAKAAEAEAEIEVAAQAEIEATVEAKIEAESEATVEAEPEIEVPAQAEIDVEAETDSPHTILMVVDADEIGLTTEELVSEDSAEGATSLLDQALMSMIVNDTDATPAIEPTKALGWPTIEDEPVEQSYKPLRAAQEPMTARHSAGESDTVEDETSSPTPIASAPVRENAQVVSLPATGTGDARARMDMMTRLREVGVPASVSPSGDAANIYEALDEILSELPATPTPPRKPGDVLVIIGDIGPALRAAQAVARTLRLRDSDIWVADLESHPVVEIGGAATTHTNAIANPRHAARIRAELVQADVASVVVVATDGTEAAPNDPWIGEMLEAMRPTAVWACVDATRKSSDTAARLALLGDIDALAVHSAAVSSSPASVWEIGIPVALLDGRTAGVPTWAGLLLGLLSTEETTAAVAEDSDSRHSRAARHRSA